MTTWRDFVIGGHRARPMDWKDDMRRVDLTIQRAFNDPRPDAYFANVPLALAAEVKELADILRRMGMGGYYEPSE